MERTAMCDREFARAAVLRRVIAGEISLQEATPLLRVSYRHAKRLLKRFRRDGRQGLVHRSVGRRSNRATPTAHRDDVLALVRQHYGGPARDPTAGDIALTETATLLSANIITRAGSARTLRARAESAERLSAALEIAAAQRCATEGVELDEEFRTVKADGSIRWPSTKAKPWAVISP